MLLSSVNSFSKNQYKQFQNLIFVAKKFQNMKRYYTTLLIILFAGYVSAQQKTIAKETQPVKADVVPVLNPEEHDHDHENEEVIPALTRIVNRKDMEREGRQTVERLKDLLPRQQFKQPLQAKAWGRILARETIPAINKELGNFGKNGGDRTRKMKLWKKQKQGKKKLESMGRVTIEPEVIREVLKR